MAVPCRTLRIRMPTAHRSHPPLSEAGHGHVVQAHIGVDAQDYPTLTADPQTELIILSGDNQRVIAIDAAESLHTDHGIATASLNLTDRQIPLEVGESVVDRLVGVTLAATSENDGNIGPLVESTTGAV